MQVTIQTKRMRIEMSAYRWERWLKQRLTKRERLNVMREPMTAQLMKLRHECERMREIAGQSVVEKDAAVRERDEIKERKVLMAFSVRKGEVPDWPVESGDWCTVCVRLSLRGLDYVIRSRHAEGRALHVTQEVDRCLGELWKTARPVLVKKVLGFTGDIQ